MSPAPAPAVRPTGIFRGVPAGQSTTVKHSISAVAGGEWLNLQAVMFMGRQAWPKKEVFKHTIYRLTLASQL